MNKRISIEQLPSVDSVNQKHLIRYVNFINSRPERKLHQKGFHTHHIYPRSIAVKNKIENPDADENLIELTPREHFIAHLILWKCGYSEMARAFWFITYTPDRYKGKISSRQYELLRKEYSLKQSILNKNRIWVKNDKENLFLFEEEAIIKVEKEGYEYG